MYWCNDDNRDEIEHDRAMLRLYDKRQYLISSLLRVVKEPYLDSFIGMLIFSHDNDEPNAMKLAKDLNFDKKDFAILKEDIEEFKSIESGEDFVDNILRYNGNR